MRQIKFVRAFSSLKSKFITLTAVLVLGANAFGATLGHVAALGAIDSSAIKFTSGTTYVRENNAGDQDAQIITDKTTTSVSFFVDGSAIPIPGIDAGSASTNYEWYRLKTALPAGQHSVTSEVVVDGITYTVNNGPVTVYSLDTPSYSYVFPNASANTFRPSDNPVRVNIDDQFNQFNNLQVNVYSYNPVTNTLGAQVGSTYTISRAQCDLANAGNYATCNLNASPTWANLDDGTFKVNLQSDTLAHNGLRFTQNNFSSVFTVDGTAPTLSNFVITNPHTIYSHPIDVSADATDSGSGVASVRFYITNPRVGDGVCDGNGSALTDQTVTTGVGGTYSASLDTSNLNGDYCLNAQSVDNAANHSSILKIKVALDNSASTPTNEYPTNDSAVLLGDPLTIDWTDVTDQSSPVKYLYESSHSSSANLDGSFSAPVYQSDLLPTSEIPASGTPAGEWYWHVRSVDSLGNKSSWSTTSHFTVLTPLTVSVANASKTYGDANPTFSPIYSGFTGGDDASTLTTAPTCTSTATSSSSTGTYPITCSGGTSSKYSFTYTDGTLTINKAAAVVTADDQSKTYGDSDPTFTYSVNGLMNEDPTSVLGSIVCTSDGSESASSHTITCTGPSSSTNYDISYVTGTLTINKAAVSVTAKNKSMTYGQNLPNFNFTATGLKNGDNKSVLGSITCTIPTNNVHAGSYTITCNGPSSSTNYTIEYATGTLTVNKADLTIKARNKTRFYGEANPTFNARYSGFVNGDNRYDLSGLLVCTTPATATSPVGIYDITCSGQTSTDYNINYRLGYLRVLPAPATITAQNQTRVYGAANPVLTSTGFIGSSDPSQPSTPPTCTTTATVTSPVGNYPIVCSGAVSSNYNFSYVAGTLTITKALLTISATDQTRQVSAANPELPFSVSGFLNGDTVAVLSSPVSCTTTATSSSPAGNYPITCGGASASNYDFAYAPATLAVTPLPATTSASSSSNSGTPTDNQGTATPAEDTTPTTDSAVLGASAGIAATSTSTPSLITHAATKTCSKLFGVCWYWWVVIIGVAATVVYLYVRSADDDKSSNSGR